MTGASSGIGEATARRLAADGWRCVLVARREDRLRALAAEIDGEVAVCDVGVRAQVEECAAAILARHPRIALLVNNAGIPARPTFLDAQLDLVERVLEVNYLGGVWLTRALLPGLRAAARAARTSGRGAHVVNVASVAGTVAFARSGPYVAAKHAQVAFSRQLRVAVSGSGISVHTVLPGFVETEGFPQTELSDSWRTRWLVTTADHVAGAIIDAVEKDRAEVTAPWFPYRFATILQGAAPGLLSRLATAGLHPSGSSDFSRTSTPATNPRVAVVTGASTGIGEATARALAAEGWRCVLVARRADLLEQIAADIGGEVEPCDLLDRAAVAALGERIIARHPHVALLVNNAGALARGTFVDVDLDEMERVTRLNYLAGVCVTRALQPGLLAAGAAGGAHVVNLASTAGLISFPAGSAYAASKHAQVAFSRSLRAALRGTGVDVHLVMPGFVRTAGFPQPRFFRSALGRRFVIGPGRVAEAVLAAVAKGRAETIVPRFPYGTSALFQSLLPSLTTRVMSWDQYVEISENTDARSA